MLILKLPPTNIKNVTKSQSSRASWSLKRLNEAGFDHLTVAILFFAAAGLVGISAIVISHAQTPPAATNTAAIPAGSTGNAFDGGSESGVNADVNSSIFGGYQGRAGQGAAFDAKTTFKVPSGAACKNTLGDSLSIWTGLQNTSKDLEQAGVIMYCPHGSQTLRYYAFTQIAPWYSDPTLYTGVTIHRGDRVTAEVNHDGSYYFTIRDNTTGRSISRHLACPSGRACGHSDGVWTTEATASSAYWLNGWGSVPFTRSTLNGAPITNFPHNKDNLVGLATTSGLSGGGEDFTVSR